MKHLFSRSLILCASTLVSLFIATQSAWGATLLINSDNVKTADISNDKLAQYEYSNNANIAGWKLCSFAKGLEYTFTNSKNYTIQSITFEGVRVSNNNGEETITISDGITTATGKTTWNNRKSTTLTTLTIDLSKLSIGNTFTIKTTYGLALRFTITYTASPSSPSTYTITYNTNGGEAIAQVTNATALPNPLPTTTKAGYRFEGWYTDEELTNPAEAGAPISDNTTLYANWTPTIYDITYEGLEGATNSGSNPATYTIETPDITFVAPGARAGYAFAGWSPASIAQGSTGNQTVTAQWKTAHTITFNANGEGATCEPASATCADGESVSLPTPTRDGFTCTGWYDAATGGKLIGAAGASYTPTEDITLYAQWEKIVEPTCMDIAAATITDDAKSMTASIGIVTVDGGQASDNYLKLSGDAKYIQLTAADGSAPFAAGDVLYVTCYNKSNSPANRGFKIKNACTLSIAATSEGVVTYTLTSNDIETDGTIKLTRTGADDRYKSVRVERCSSTPALPPCQTPTINTKPIAATYCAGETIAALSVAASVTDKGTLSYQWQKDGTNIDGATNVTYTPSATGTYTCVVTNNLDGYTPASTTSDAAVITINAATAITTTQPTEQTVVQGENATLTVEASGSGTLTYQWYTCQSDGSNPQPISGATAATYTVTPNALGTTYYKVEVTGDCGTATSEVVSITASKECGELIRATLTGATTADVTGAVAGSADVNTQDNHKLGSNGHFVGVSLKSGYTFKENDTVVINVTIASDYLRIYSDKGTTLLVESSSVTTGENRLVLPAEADGVSTLYLYRNNSDVNPTVSYMAVRRECCSEKKPVLTADKTTLCGEESVEFTATNFTAGATLTLYKEGEANPVEVKGPTVETSVTFTAVVINTTTKYYVIASNDCDKSSDPVLISVLPPATFTKQPTNAEIWLSGKTTLAVEAEGAGTLTYQWYTCDSKGSNEQAIADATAATYTVNPDEEGVTYYKVVVKDECSSTIPSNVVSVTANKLCGELIRATLTGAKTADVTGAVAGSAEVSVSNSDGNTEGYKLGANNNYIAVSLKSGYTFKANDTVVINVTAKSSCLRIYSDKGTTLLVESSPVTTGENRLVLPEDADGVKTLYLYRTGSDMNPFVSYMAVRRPCCDIPKIRWSAVSAEIDYIEVSPELPTLSNTSGVPVSYSSDDTDVATIDENGVVSIKGAGTTSINAIYTATGATYCSHTVSYTLVVRCAVAPLIQQGSSVVSGCNEQVELTAVRSDNSSDYDSGSFQWYRNGVAINGAQDKTYFADQVGTYTVSYSPAGVDCSQMSTNKAVVTSSIPQPVVEKKAPHRNYQIANRDLRPYTSATHYPLFDVTPKATAEYTGDKWKSSYTIHHAGTVTAGNATIDWVRVDATTTTTISLGADYEALGTWLSTNGFGEKNVGDTIMLTMRTINSCNDWDDATADSIPIILTNRYSLAYIVSGDTITRKFYDITKSDTTDQLYQNLCDQYNVTPVSAYATYQYSNYEPYDLLLLTDYPKGTGSNNQKDYVNALADLVDKKPILSLKAHMSALSEWSAKGFTSNPVVPGDGSEGQAQKTLTVLCFSHDMFAGAQWDNADDRTLTILDNVYKDGSTHKGIQGFLAINSANFVNIAKVYDAKGNRNLVACCERQDVTAARFIMLSINQGATKYINPAGQDAIDKLLKYLLWTEATNVSDCSLTFDNGEGDCKDCSGGKREFTEGGKKYTSGDHQWNNPANWNAKAIPTQLQNVRIEANCIVSGNTYGAGNIRIKEGKTLTIAPNGGLASVGQFAYYSGINWNQPQPIPNAGYITVQANKDSTGMLMHSHTDQLAATVQMYSPAYYDGGKVTDGHERIWSYVAIPVQEGTVPQIFNGAYTYLWSEAGGWIRYTDGSTFHAFDGIALSQPSPQTFTFAGNLALAKEYKLTLTNGGSMSGMNLIGNSWTAPIQITKLETADFGKGLEATVYIYSTGRDPDGRPATTETQGDTAAGYWTAIPIAAAKGTGWKGPKIIPAMQAFEVNFATDATSATLTLDYNTIVRASGVDYKTLNQKLYAPGRNSTAEILQPDPSAPAPYEPTMLRIRVADTAACYNLHLLQGERFSEGFDNGWDGFYTGTDGRAPGLCALTTAGEMQVSAQPEIDNTTLVFTPGRSNTYTFSFCLTETEDEPLAAPLYLNDMQLRKSCLIDDSRTYTFQSSENDMENRFVISHIAFEEQDTPTGIANLATVDQQLMLSNPAREALTIRIYDPAGKLCSEQQTDAPLLQLSLPTTQGVYMLYITGEQTQILRKAIQ